MPLVECEFLNARSAWKPLQSGIEISMMMTWGAQLIPSAIASVLPKATRHAISSNDRYAANACAASELSSTTKTRNFISPDWTR